jgi:acyl carrier protein
MEPAPTAEDILLIARDVFGREIGRGDDFFSLGGDSLNATELVDRLEEVLGRDIDVQDVWEAESIYAFAESVLAGPRQ